MSFVMSRECHLRPEPENYGSPGWSAHIREILNDWLQQEKRRDIQKRIEFSAVLRPAVRNELATQAVLHVTHRHGVVKAHRKRLVAAEAGSEHRVGAGEVGTAPVAGRDLGQ